MHRTINVLKLKRWDAIKEAFNFLALAFYPRMGHNRLWLNENHDEVIFTCSNEFCRRMKKIKLEAEQDAE